MPLPVRLDGPDSLHEKLTRFSPWTDGDSYEKRYEYVTAHWFWNYERFWRWFVVPLTNRILPELAGADPLAMRFRDEISAEARRVAANHYTILVKIVYAYRHLALLTPESLRDFHASSFEDFYIHLGSACDQVEEFLTNFIFLTRQHEIAQVQFTRDDILEAAAAWYEENKGNIFEWYVKKGKDIRIPNPGRGAIVTKYYGDVPDVWKCYCRVSGGIRAYRNFIIHNIHMGKHFPYEWSGSGGRTGGLGSGSGVFQSPEWTHFGEVFPLVPRIEKLGKYKTWDAVTNLDPEQREEDCATIQADFVDMKQQMVDNFNELLGAINGLWEKAIADAERIVKHDGPVLREHFKLEPLP
jgi:hypothetical protein